MCVLILCLKILVSFKTSRAMWKKYCRPCLNASLIMVSFVIGPGPLIQRQWWMHIRMKNVDFSGQYDQLLASLYHALPIKLEIIQYSNWSLMTLSHWKSRVELARMETRTRIKRTFTQNVVCAHPQAFVLCAQQPFSEVGNSTWGYRICFVKIWSSRASGVCHFSSWILSSYCFLAFSHGNLWSCQR